MDDRDSNPSRGFSHHRGQTGSGAHQTSHPLGRSAVGAFSSRIMWQEHEADHSVSCAAEVDNTWSYASLHSNTSSWHMTNFTITF